MSNINWGQFVNSFISGYNTARANTVQTPQFNQAPQIQNQETQLNQTLMPKTFVQLSQTASELAPLNPSEVTTMLKELFVLPKNFENLLAQLTSKSAELNNLNALMLLSSELNLNQLSNLLQNNSKDAMTNLYQMLAQFNRLELRIKDEQLNQITKLISFVGASASSDVQSLKTVMLMYLPWLPLSNPEAFKLEITNKGQDGGIFSDDFVSVLISTQNYGNIQADIFKTEKDGIKILIITSETFPQKDFISLMKEESIKHNININIEHAKKEVFNKNNNEETQTQIFMNVSSGVNPFLLLISNTLIRNIHIIDEKENLREQRKEMLDNGEN